MESTTKPYHWEKRWRRWQIGIHVYHHVYITRSADRWVFQPWLIWDRKEK